MFSRSMLARPSIALAALLALPAFGLAQFDDGSEAARKNQSTELTDELKTEILEDVKDILVNRAFVPGLDFSTFDSLVEKHKKSFDEAKSDNAFTGSVNRALREFGISHVGLRTPESARRRRGGDLAEFLQLHDQPQDLLTLVQRRSAQDEDEAPKYVEWRDNDVAVVRLRSFSSGYDRDEIEKQVREAMKARQIIVDLRSNGGGAVSNLSHLLGLFIDSEKPVGTFVNKRAHQAYVAANKDDAEADIVKIAEWYTRKFTARNPRERDFKPYSGQVAVLVNRGSASASEIFAAAMRDVAGAKIVGGNTRGAVLASVYGRLPGGYELQYPVSDYVTIKGRRLEGNPLEPDVPAAGRTTGEFDPYIEAALKALNTQANDGGN